METNENLSHPGPHITGTGAYNWSWCRHCTADREAYVAAHQQPSIPRRLFNDVIADVNAGRLTPAAAAVEASENMSYALAHFQASTQAEAAGLAAIRAAVARPAAVPQPSRPIEYVTCDCGHTIPRLQRMTASTGTACPDCYDRMS